MTCLSIHYEDSSTCDSECKTPWGSTESWSLFAPLTGKNWPLAQFDGFLQSKAVTNDSSFCFDVETKMVLLCLPADSVLINTINDLGCKFLITLTARVQFVPFLSVFSRGPGIFPPVQDSWCPTYSPMGTAGRRSSQYKWALFILLLFSCVICFSHVDLILLPVPEAHLVAACLILIMIYLERRGDLLYNLIY